MRTRSSVGGVLVAARAASLTYAEVGATAREELPTGYRHQRRERVVGEGLRTFDATAKALLGWQMHRAAGLRVSATAPVAVPGVVVVLGFRVRAPRLRAPCRVVYEVRQERRVGFAYGTLPGHPEAGEEAFVVKHRSDDRVVLQVTAFSRPGTWYARLAGPLNPALQHVVTRRYAGALRRTARDHP